MRSRSFSPRLSVQSRPIVIAGLSPTKALLSCLILSRGGSCYRCGECRRTSDRSKSGRRRKSGEAGVGVVGENDVSIVKPYPALSGRLAACADVAGRLRGASATSKSKDLSHHARQQPLVDHYGGRTDFRRSDHSARRSACGDRYVQD